MAEDTRGGVGFQSPSSLTDRTSLFDIKLCMAFFALRSFLCMTPFFTGRQPAHGVPIRKGGGRGAPGEGVWDPRGLCLVCDQEELLCSLLPPDPHLEISEPQGSLFLKKDLECSLSGIHTCTSVPQPPPGTEQRFVVHRKRASAGGRGGHGPHRPVSEVSSQF